jgi:hypothetical protein
MLNVIIGLVIYWLFKRAGIIGGDQTKDADLIDA